MDTTAERQALVTEVDGLTHLLGSVCGGCGTHSFPRQRSCPRCGGIELADTALPRQGKVWTFTVQRFKPKAPFRTEGEFEPFALGYVDLGPLKVESVLSGRAVGEWKIGSDVELVVRTVEGRMTFSYAPLEVGK